MSMVVDVRRLSGGPAAVLLLAVIFVDMFSGGPWTAAASRLRRRVTQAPAAVYQGASVFVVAKCSGHALLCRCLSPCIRVLYIVVELVAIYCVVILPSHISEAYSHPMYTADQTSAGG